jgi:sulfur relay (sulfurtransferase) complex TusBCD TusD component (DsrE family)
MEKSDDNMNQHEQEKPSKVLTILLIKSPYVSEAADIAFKTALRAKRKGYKVNIFLYLDGTWNAHLTSDKNYNNPGDWLKRVIRKKIDVKACERCSSARDLVNCNIIDGVEISGSSVLIDFLMESDKVLTFGG